ncbi:sugar transferase [Clostridium perfringens]|uniref:sugar transferase n=1 Tax=Clostridium perfringens TaxID=1502 RepID=UPI0018E46F93|nr:sugar transferase [Clostridium perfringens]MBI5995324.1 sugar transferase [Clostridium perfringens]MDZ4964574.1 sugar transferase [Clostridium perfringens]MDZ5013102.1 sugar transferase [Clostridium perfringens]
MEELLKKYNVKQGFYAKYIKRILDILISLFGIIILSPVLIIVSGLVRIKLGSPILFKQKRTGKNEKDFYMIKFRTMTDERDENGNLLPDTKRFTKFGDFLRTSSLDELPELFSVLRGDMSLVGPRPLYPFYIPYYTEEESLRHATRVGITGLAQVNGRALCRWDERFKYDVQYVKNITFIGDMKILFKTVYKVFVKDDIGIPSVTEEGGLHIVRKVQRPEKLLLTETLKEKNVPVFLKKNEE